MPYTVPIRSTVMDVAEKVLGLRYETQVRRV